MKTLYLLRHAKSRWDDPTLSDFARPLNKRGKKDAPLIGRFMHSREIQPDVIISSPAERAKQTVQLVADKAKFKTIPRFDARIYNACVAELCILVAEIDDAVNEVLLVGHNSSMEEFLEYLTAEVRHMPTAALACLTLNCDTRRNVQTRVGKLKWLVKPKELEKH
ncbi:MAG: phosphohistidine phosphatase SixA [Pyrinomonadaceae bacterium]